MRRALRALSISPALAARLATVLFRTPPRHRHSDLEQAALSTGERLDLPLPGRDRIVAWRWGRGPLVLLVHGWGSRGARLASFIRPLVDAGYSVAAFDAPGHGASAGRLSSLPQFMRALRAVASRLGPVHAVVAHSMGAAATALEMARGLQAGRAVFLAPAADPAGYSELFARTLGLSTAVLDRMKRNLEKRFGLPWKDFDVLRAARARTIPLLVFHDAEDPEVPWRDGSSIASEWPAAELVTTRGLGHRRIVHDPAVVSRAVAFLTSAGAATRLAGRA